MKHQKTNVLRIISFSLILLFFGLMSASVTHAETYTFATKWGSSGTGDGQFGGQEGIAVDSSGNIYISDYGNNRIQKFNSSDGKNYTFVTYVGDKQSAANCTRGPANGQFGQPAGIAVDSSGNVYIGDTGNQCIKKFDRNGSFITKWSFEESGQIIEPRSLDVDSLGNVYFSDTFHHCVEKYDIKSNYFTKWTHSDSLQFWYPIGVACDSSGNIYIGDFNNHIMKFKSNGTYVSDLGTNGSGEGQLYHPRGVAVDSFGNVYVADCLNNRIEKFDSNGKYVTQLNDNGQFDSPEDVAVDSSGNVYVLAGNSIFKYAIEPVLPDANFSSNVTEGYAPLLVQFTDKSLNTTGWNWDFGDGTNSTEQNPKHTYYKAGIYTVKLIASNANDIDSKTSEINVKSNLEFAYITNSGSNTVSVIDIATNTVKATVPVGMNPNGVAITPDGKKVYVTNSGSNTVSVIDTATNNVTSTINVGNYPMGIAVTPDGKEIYVANLGSNNVSIIDAATYKVVATVSYDVESQPYGIAVTPDGKEVYVANSGNNVFGDNFVSVIDTATHGLIKMVNVHNHPHGIAVTSDGKKVYVANSGEGVVSVIDTATKTVTDIGLGSVSGPREIAVTPDGKKAYVTNNIGTFSVIDSATNTVTASVPVGSYPEGVAVTQDGKKVYLAIPGDNSISVVDTATNTVTAKVPVGSNPTAFGLFIGNPPVQPLYPVANFSNNLSQGVAPLNVQFADLSENAIAWKWDFGDGTNSTEQNPKHTYYRAGIYTVKLIASNANGIDSKTSEINVKNASLAGPFAYITNPLTNTVSVVDTVTNTFAYTVKVGYEPFGVAVNPAGTKVYVANSRGGTVSIIDTATNIVTDTVNVGDYPRGIAFNPDGSKVYVTNERSGTVSVIDTASNAVIATVTVGGGPYGVAVSPDGTKVFVASPYSNAVSVIDTATNNVISTVTVGNNPIGVTVTPDGTKVYVPNYYSDTVSVIDKATNTVIDTVNVGNRPWGIAVTPDGTKVYVTNSGSNNVSVIDKKTNTVKATVNVGNVPYGVAVNIDGTKVYVANYNDGTVSVIDTASNAVIATVPAGNGPWAFGQFVGPAPVLQPILPVANFSSNVTEGYPPLSIQFEDLSVNATKWNWDFGDGGSSTEENPIHIYYTPGCYKVALTASHNAVNNTITKNIYIKIPAASSINLTSITLDPENSTGQTTDAPGAWSTNLGDPLGQIGVIGNNGVYLNQPISFTGGSLGEISIPLEYGINNFTLDADMVFPGNEYYGAVLFFNGVATPPQIAVYNSNGGSGNYSVQANGTPIMGGANGGLFFDSAPGTSVYIALDGTKVEVVSFVIDSKSGTIDSVSWGDIGPDGYGDTVAKLTLRVTPPIKTAPVASFSASPTSGNSPLIVNFTDTSTGVPTAWNWDFGDGNTSNEQNVSHTYTSIGSYTVNLTVSNANGTDSKTGKINVNFQHSGGSLTLTETQIRSGTAGYPDIYGERIVYQDWRNGNSDIYLYNISTGQETQITNDKPWAARPSIYGNRIVWVDYRNDKSNIRMYDLTTSTETQITNSGAATEPEIYGDRIVYQDSRNGIYDIYIYNISTSEETRLTNDGLYHYYPAIYDDRIVWQDSSNGYDIYMYNISTAEKIQITTNNSAQVSASIYGDKIVWLDSRNGPWKVYMYDIPTHEETQITTDESYQGGPRIYGDRIVYVSNNLICMYDVSTRKETGITTSGYSGRPRTYGDRIVYGTNTNDIRMCTILEQKPEPKIPTANFSSNVTKGYAPLSVQFNDSSENATSLKWDFGDGINSTEQNPMHTYSASGTYTVNLTASNANSTNSRTSQITVLESLVLPVANFSSNITEGYALLSIQFNDSSENATSLNWDFGDGSNSTEKNPMHTYSAAGNYNVNLTATNANGTNSKLAMIIVNQPVPPEANFSSNITSGIMPLTVSFTDISTGGPTAWTWSFGDGNNSTEKNPIYTYSKAGIYTVKLKVRNSAGSSTLAKSKYITVTTGVVAPNADFTASPTIGNVPLVVTFTDDSIGSPDSWKWNFGDGNNSTERNPVNIYSKAGNYSVKLTVKNAKGSSTMTKTGYIQVIAPPIAAFSASPLKGKAPLTVTFKDLSKGSPKSREWSFGDGNISTSQNPVNVYTTPAMYTVSLNVTNDAGSNITEKLRYINVIK